MMYRSLVCVLIVLLLQLTPSLCCADESIALIIVDSAYEYPNVIIPIVSIQPDGSLHDIDGKPIDDKRLNEMLSRTRRVNDKQVSLVRLQSSCENDVSMQLLGKVLQRIRSQANPKAPTTVYLYLRELPASNK